MNTSYLLFMSGSALIAAGAHFLLAKNLKKRGLLTAITFVFGAVLGVLCAKLSYCLIALGEVLTDGLAESLFTDSMECMSFLGGAAGVVLGAVLAAKSTGNRVMPALNAWAPAGALLAALARFAEGLAGTVNVGRIIEDEAYQFFPLAVGVDFWGYTEWYLAVFMFSGLACLAAAVFSLKAFRDRRFLRTLFYLCLPQILFESLRNYNRLTWTQFVRAEQLLCMIAVEAVLLLYGVWQRRGLRGFAPALTGLGCAGLFVAVEFALDKTDIPHIATYAVMIAGLVLLAAAEMRGHAKLKQNT